LSAVDGIAALDQLSQRLLEAVPDLRVALAITDAEREAVARVRRRHVQDAGWETDDADAYDATALHIAAWRGGDLVGTMRLVLPGPDRRLPVEEDFGLAVEPRGKVAEAGRLVVAPEERGDPAHRIWGALFARTWLELRSHGCTVLAGAASPRMVRTLRGLGLPFEVLGPAREHRGRQRHPVRLDPSTARPRWFDGGQSLRTRAAVP
jgi:hypothetical protein